MSFMKKTALATAFVAMALVTTVASASMIVINFDNLTGGRFSAGELVTNQYQGLGVTFSDSYSGGAYAENFLGTFIPGSSTPNVLWTNQGGGSTTGQYLQINFASAQNSVQALFGTSLNARITMDAYNGATLVGSVTQTGSTILPDMLSGLIGLSHPDITSVRLYSTYGNNTSFNFSIDNLQITAVPEPEEWAMMLLGLLMIGWAARRKQSIAAPI